MKTNKRSIKKQIKMICGELAGQCVMAREVSTPETAEKWNALIFRIADLQVNSLGHCTFAFDKNVAEAGGTQQFRRQLHAYRKAAFTHLRDEFNNEVNEIVKEMNALLTPAQKEENKSSVSI